MVSLIKQQNAKCFKTACFWVTLTPPKKKKCMEEFCNLNGLARLIKKPICFKNLTNPHALILF